MKSILIYAAPTAHGTSAIIAKIMNNNITKGIELINLAEGYSKEQIDNSDTLIFVAATYGDQELHDTVEDFILTINESFSKYNYAVCEIGNYYGYDDFELGAGEIIEKHMTKFGGHPLLAMHSVDSLPVLDERKLNKWIAKLNTVLT